MFVILTCRSNYETRMESIRQTWLSEVPNENFIFLADDSDKDRRMVYDQRIPLGYEFVQMKYYHFLSNLRSLIDVRKFDYFFFADDDTFINVNNLSATIERLGSEPAWIGDPITVTGWDTPDHRFIGNHDDFPELGFRYPSGGAGFIANKNLVLQISDYLSTAKSIAASKWSDMTFGVWASNSGGCKIIEDKDLFHGATPNFPIEEYESSVKKSLTFHYVDHVMQRKLWDIVS
jgi:hypothetical protein